MAKGIIRKIDYLGRIVIPMEFRKTFGINEKDPLGMTMENDVIHLVKADENFRGIVRNLDELGRYTIPIESRRELSLEIGQKVDIFVEGESICIRKDGCGWCGSTKDLSEVDGHVICQKCIDKVAVLAKGA